MNLDILEPNHTRHGSCGCEWEISDVDLCVCQCSDDGAFAAVWRTDQDYLAGAASRDMKYIGLFRPSFLCGGIF